MKWVPSFLLCFNLDSNKKKKGEREWYNRTLFLWWVISPTSSDGLFRTSQANATYNVVMQYWWMIWRGLWEPDKSLAFNRKSSEIKKKIGRILCLCTLQTLCLVFWDTVCFSWLVHELTRWKFGHIHWSKSDLVLFFWTETFGRFLLNALTSSVGENKGKMP